MLIAEMKCGDNSLVIPFVEWQAFAIWADGLKATEFPNIVTMATGGYCDAIRELLEEMQALGEVKSASSYGVMEWIKQVVDGHGPDSVIVVTEVPEDRNVKTAKLPKPPGPDPYGMKFTDEELAALTDTNNEETELLAYDRALPGKKVLLNPKTLKGKFDA